MIFTVQIPDSLSGRLQAACGDLNRALLEGFAVEAYRQGQISVAEITELLGHGSHWQTRDFLAGHDAWPGTTAEEAMADLETLRSLRR